MSLEGWDMAKSAKPSMEGITGVVEMSGKVNRHDHIEHIAAGLGI
jgi:hypothetical protein